MRAAASAILTCLVLTSVSCTHVRDVPAPEPDEVREPAPMETDPYAWLEEIDGEVALAWVREQNERTRLELASTPGFQSMYEEALAVLGSESRIPSLTFKGRDLYNLWRGPENPRGIYRRTTLEQLRSGDPQWTTVIDVDELSRREGTPWVFKGMSCLPPEHRRCLVSLSPGGGDAVEIRELDSRTFRFVSEGFFLPTAKSSVEWIDENAIVVGTDFGPGSMTDSGYPRIVKVWKRGTPLVEAATLYEGDPSSVSVSARRLRTATGDIDLVHEGTTFWTADHYLVSGLGSSGEGATARLTKLELPETAVVNDGFRGRLVITLKEEWSRAGRTFRSGSVVLADPRVLTGAPGEIEVLVEPTAGAIVEDVEVADEVIYVTMLDQVRGRLYRFRPAAEGWTQVPLPDNGAVSVMTVHGESGDALVKFESFVVPPTLYLVEGRAAAVSPAVVAAQEPTFDGSRFDVTQQFAVSRDGTRVPYFVVAPKGMLGDGSRPTHIFSYGGFRNSLTPSYSGSYEQHYGAYGRLWLEPGGVFVLANIRGGGEFGPEWHASVLKENRRKVFEDFEAVAEDLVRSGITSPSHLGIEGRSNGGLLTLATMVRRPDLYGAVISGAPLADMRRYHEMLAGASWMAEYGDPDVPAESAYLSKYSPYQNLRADADYPPLFVYASTRDDRVHPGHARKVVAKKLDQGHEVWYWENIEGGHGGSSTNEQLAWRIALSYAHLWRNLR
ncbi:MAG TPA: prolyl oligopeptidase family serine peptidase [Thermoanaerobaculia bacterium]|nr:prolyl oligopeptidase family serine peptidase [Thermoanaerobaculia bacterium]